MSKQPKKSPSEMTLLESEKDQVRALDTEMMSVRSQLATIVVEIARLEHLKISAIGQLLQKQREAESYVADIVKRLGKDPEVEVWDLDASTMKLSRR